MDISEVIAPDSDEMVAADLIGSPPQVFTIAEVTQAARDGKRVANIRLEEFPRPWRPGKGMSRVMADNWGRETEGWVGRKVELYGDPDVYFGKEKTGGVRISRLSHISAPKTTRTNPRGGKNSTWTVQPLPDAPPAKDWDAVIATAVGLTDLDALSELWKREGVGNAPKEVQAEISARAAAIKAQAEGA